MESEISLLENKGFADRWLERFNRELATIELEADAFLIKGKIADYFTIAKDTDSMLSLHFTDQHDLPNAIVHGITTAFNRSKPESRQQ